MDGIDEVMRAGALNVAGITVRPECCYSKGMLACGIMLGRRWVLQFTVVAGVFLGFSGICQASLARALGLSELVIASQHVVIGVPGEAWSRWENVGPSRRIVTYTRVKVEETISGTPSGAELLVRTLGGRVGDIGQITYGEAVLKRGQRSMLFVRPDQDGRLTVTGMAQGHFPVKADNQGFYKLLASPELAELVGVRDSAVSRLVGKTVSESQRLILGVTEQ